MAMLGFLWWLVIGLVAGLLARFLIPGKQPMGWILTAVLGLVGSVVGGGISSVMFGTDPTDPGFHPAGLVMSTVGAAIVLGLYVYFTRRKGIA
jgi:uncharacterized membrane protein YeaQ/YmgE (transglycosylase-associated protein family)